MSLRGNLQLFMSSSLHHFLTKFPIVFYLLPVELLSLTSAPQTSKEKNAVMGAFMSCMKLPSSHFSSTMELTAVKT